MAETGNKQDILGYTNTPSSKTRVWITTFLGLVIVLLVAGCVALALYGQHKINTLNGKNARLQSNENSLEGKNKSLTDMVTNLQKAYAVLKATDTGSNGGSTVDTSPKTTSSFTIGKVQEKTEADFGVTGSSSSTPVLAVTVTIKNLGLTNQTYTAYEFSAITNSGVVKRTPGWADGPPVYANFWMQSTVAPGGTDTEVVAWYFSDYTSFGFTTVEFSPPDSTPTQSLPLPALSN